MGEIWSGAFTVAMIIVTVKELTLTILVIEKRHDPINKSRH